MIAEIPSAITAGAYTPQQAAIIAGVHYPAKVRRWLFGRGGTRAVYPYYGDDQDELISFYDLVQIMAINRIRSKRPVGLRKIRETIDTAHRYGVDFPFAKSLTTYVWGREIAIRLDDDTAVGATGKIKDDLLFSKIVLHPMDDIGFDSEGMAESYTPISQNGRSIVLHRNRRWGAPIVMPANCSVETLVMAVDAEGSILRAATAYGVAREDVLLALEYEELLQRGGA